MKQQFALEIENLTKTYYGQSGTVHALDNVSLKIKSGSFFGFLGPNGAGKTTLMNIIANLVSKDSGKIAVHGKDFDLYQAEIKYSLGIVPQELVLDPFFSVYEALEIFAGYYGVKKSQRKTAEIIEALGLSDKAHINPRGLSGGMKRRLLIAKALVHDPDIIILDEPTAGVDVELRDQLWSYIQKLNKKGKTIILTTHYLEEAENLCDEIAIINKGKIIAYDKTENLKKIFGKKKIVIELKKSSADIIANFKQYGAVSITDNILTLQYDTIEFTYAEFIKTLHKISDHILNISTEESDIEDIFKYLIANN